jgi:hypothetical protein
MTLIFVPKDAAALAVGANQVAARIAAEARARGLPVEIVRTGSRGMRVRKVMSPKNGLADWEITVKLAQAMGVPMHYAHAGEILDEIAATTPSFAGISFAKLDEAGGLGPVALQRKSPRRDAGHAYRHLHAGQRQICADRRADRAALSPAAHDRTYPQSL